MPEIIFSIIVSVYFLLLVAFTLGLTKRLRKNNNNTPRVSVIVCARNEEASILACLKSLSLCEYPADKYEIIIADDNSTDETGKITDAFIADKSIFRKIKVQQSEKLKGKINALQQGIEASSGEIILLTDADCQVPQTWISSVVSYYQENTGMVCGFSSINAESVFNGMQAVDLTFLISVASGTANIGKPVSCIGNNISFLRKAYNETGGFENYPFSVTEDFLLLNKIASLKKYNILFPVDEAINVITLPCRDVKTLTAQKKRWGAGGLKASPYGLFIMSTAFISNLFVLLTVLFFSSVWLSLTLFKISADYFFLYPVHQKLDIKRNLRYFIFYEIYYTIYILVLPFLLLMNKTISWKGREF